MASGRSLTSTAAIVFVATVASCGGCTRPAPGFCCLTAEDCGHFGVDEVRACSLDESCIGNQCVPTPDADMPDAATPCSLAGGHIVFATNRDGDFDIAIAYADGTGYRNLTTNAWDDTAPVFSPDGSMIAWLSNESGDTFGNELYVMRADGSGAVDVSAGYASDPRWSSDGTRLAFVTNRDGGLLKIYVVDADGSNLTNVTMGSNDASAPSWSPDDTKIVFVSTRLGSYDVFAMNADGSNPMRLIDQADTSEEPVWSPTGSQIAWVYADETSSMLWVMNANGTNAVPIAPAHPPLDWSPDGLAIAYEDLTSDVHIISPDGSADTNLTNDQMTNDDKLVGWSPDGTQLVIDTDRDGNQEVYTVGRTGTLGENISNDPGIDMGGSWARCPP